MHILLHSVPPTLQQATADPCFHWRLLDTQGQVGSVSCGVTSLSPGSWCTRFCLCPPRVYFPVLCTFWQLYDGVSGDRLQKGLCHIQVCCTQSPCPCGSPLLTHTSTGDGQTQFCLSLCGVPVSRCAQGLFEPSEHLWLVWGLILHANSPLLPSCWGFPLPLGMGYLLIAVPAQSSHHSSAYHLAGAYSLT